MGKTNPRATRKMYLKKLTGEVVKYNTTSSRLKNISMGEFSTLSSRIAVKANYKPKASDCKSLSYNAGNYTTRPLYKGSNIWIVSSDLSSRWHNVDKPTKSKAKKPDDEVKPLYESKKPKDFNGLIKYHLQQQTIKQALS